MLTMHKKHLTEVRRSTKETIYIISQIGDDNEYSKRRI